MCFCLKNIVCGRKELTTSEFKILFCIKILLICFEHIPATKIECFGLHPLLKLGKLNFDVELVDIC